MEELQGEADSGRGCYETFAPLAVQVNRVIKQRDALADLCGEVLATFTLPSNAERVAALGPEFPDVLARWRKRFEDHSGNR